MTLTNLYLFAAVIHAFLGLAAFCLLSVERPFRDWNKGKTATFAVCLALGPIALFGWWLQRVQPRRRNGVRAAI